MFHLASRDFTASVESAGASFYLARSMDLAQFDSLEPHAFNFAEFGSHPALSSKALPQCQLPRLISLRAYACSAYLLAFSGELVFCV